jgi:hypothetical protein
MSDYPKIMHKGGAEISVGNESEEAAKRDDGWSAPGDPVVADADEPEPDAKVKAPARHAKPVVKPVAHNKKK